MATPFIPEVGEKVVIPTVKPVTRKGVLNTPEIGTSIRARSGSNTIVGYVNEHTDYAIVPIRIPCNSYWPLVLSVPADGSWTFEILSPEEMEQQLSGVKEEYLEDAIADVRRARRKAGLDEDEDDNA